MKCLTLFALLAGISLSVSAQTFTIPETIRSHEHPSPTTDTDEQRAKDWGLNTEEWHRYNELMKGPLGVYSPNVDPLTALGIEATSEDEQRRYAELQVQTEAKRVEKLLAYQRAYDAAWKRLYPALQPVSLIDPGLSSPIPDDSRLAVFVKDKCAACTQRVRQLQTAGTAFDIYVVDSKDDDTVIRIWAKQTGIDPGKVRSRVITLNHDAGQWLSLGVPGDLPAILRKVNGQWQRQP